MSEVTLNDLISERAELNTAKKALTEKLGEVKTSIDQVDKTILILLKKQGLPGAKGIAGSVLIQEKTVYNIQDYAAFSAWMIEQQKPEVLQKRLALTVVEKYKSQFDELPPGVVDFEKEVIKFSPKRGT